MHNLRSCGLQLLKRNRLGQIIKGSVAHGDHRIGNRAVCCEQNDGCTPEPNGGPNASLPYPIHRAYEYQSTTTRTLPPTPSMRSSRTLLRIRSPIPRRFTCFDGSRGSRREYPNSPRCIPSLPDKFVLSLSVRSPASALSKFHPVKCLKTHDCYADPAIPL